LSWGREINNKHIINIIGKYIIERGLESGDLIDHSKSSTHWIDG